MKPLSRRDFLKASALSMGAVVISTGLAGCLSSSDDDDRSVAFTHGVASGDPLQDGIMLWTRVKPENADPVTVDWEVATDAGFSSLTHSGSTQANAAHDFIVKVDVRNLAPGQTVYFRFRAAGKTSPTGTTRTLPAGDVSEVSFAVMSCANYPAGYFHVYAEAAKEEKLDAVIHLGDYIYEYGAGGYATEDAEALGRTLPADNSNELLTLADYRKRYALYRSDPDLQNLHAAAPFISVWDDHEVANDAWREGAENHNADEGDYTARKLGALQAYFEWTPIRPVSEGNESVIYRSFNFGNLVSLHMMDTRIIGRDEQLSYANYLTGSGIDSARFTADLTDSNRTMLGAEQLGWVQNAIGGSTATWQVLGQQVLMGRMNLPAELLSGFLNPSPAILALFQELAILKTRYLQGDPSLTAGEIARVETVLPYNLDAWDGYVYERETLLETARATNKNLVVLAGDTHNAWASDLKTVGGEQVGVEFATSSVSSPGLEEYLGLPEDQIAGAEQAIALLVDDLKYVNVNQRGYMMVTFTPDEARADWRFVSTIKDKDYGLDTARAQSLTTLPGAGNRKIVIGGSGITTPTS
ncbi:alkaline phosphatase D family protein [Marinobacter sp. BGYM27]|uniref:alkaline phosphatase D family protein n=1 Tax=Marinobacter sp. BGYM27 TaxID=2975597 RepID=UPI0021A50671|nr:alkaline phosphatase D family protein [Marinobacter sp. BGYM27]MDG5499489.1 alkaline phosphatase D family protein [Marinobacter sp. BGYM27]